MAIQTIIAEEMGSVRSKINQNFNDIQGQINAQNTSINGLTIDVDKKTEKSFSKILVNGAFVEAPEKESLLELVAGKNIYLLPSEQTITINYVAPSTIKKTFQALNFTKSTNKYSYTIPLDSAIGRCRFILDIQSLEHAGESSAEFNGGRVAIEGTIDPSTATSFILYTGVATSSGLNAPVPFSANDRTTFCQISEGTGININYSGTLQQINSFTLSIMTLVSWNHLLNACDGSLYVFPF